MVKYLEPLIFWEVRLPFDKNKKQTIWKGTSLELTMNMQYTPKKLKETIFVCKV